MLVLEARFRSGQTPPILVGHVVWSAADDAHPTVQPARSLMTETSPSTLLSKLEYLIASTAPDSFRRLQGLHSAFWSFIDVSPG